MILEEHRAQNKMLDDENKRINEALRLIDQEEEILKRSIQKYERTCDRRLFDDGLSKFQSSFSLIVFRISVLESLGRHGRQPPPYPAATSGPARRSTFARAPAGGSISTWSSPSTSQQRCYDHAVRGPTWSRGSYKRPAHVDTAPYRTRRQNAAPSPLPLCPERVDFTPGPSSSSYSPRNDFAPPFPPVAAYKPRNDFAPPRSVYPSHGLTWPTASHSASTPINYGASTPPQPSVRYSASSDFGPAQVPTSAPNAQHATGSFGSASSL